MLKRGPRFVPSQVEYNVPVDSFVAVSFDKAMNHETLVADMLGDCKAVINLREIGAPPGECVPFFNEEPLTADNKSFSYLPTMNLKRKNKL